MAENNTSNIGFEKQIWDAACVLRGNIDASEYKSVVLGLIFLKYISDRFEAKYKELVEEGDGFEEDQDEYTAENIFFVPENARWSAIAAAAHTPEIGTVIDDAMRSIEKENKRLKDEKLGLTADELAFYDALTKPQAIKDFYEHDELIAITKELTDLLRKNQTIDWQKKESARAGMRRLVKRLLKKHKYPPEGMDDAVQTVMSQCEMWTDNVMTA